MANDNYGNDEREDPLEIRLYGNVELPEARVIRDPRFGKSKPVISDRSDREIVEEQIMSELEALGNGDYDRETLLEKTYGLYDSNPKLRGMIDSKLGMEGLENISDLETEALKDMYGEMVRNRRITG